MYSKKILLFGGSGFLGSSILKKYKKIYSPPHSAVDLEKLDKVFDYIYKKEPESIIYAAGITKIDFAQKNKLITNKINYDIPNKISKFCSENKIKFIYISTNAVFDGYKNKFQFSEFDKPIAKSVYGNSKLFGENAILSNGNNNCVIRVITLFGIGDKSNFLQKMINNLTLGKEFFGIYDQIQNPLNVDIAAESILFATKNNLKGIYNLGSLDYDSNFNFLVNVAKEMSLDYKLIKKISFRDFQVEKFIYRKKKCVLITDKFREVSGDKILKTLNASISYLNLK